MLFVNPLNEAEKLTLEAMRDNHPLAITRKRAHSILLSDNGYHIPYITEILGVCRQSLALWIKNWDLVGLLALIEDTRSGRPRKLPAEEEKKVITKIKDSPRCIKKLIAEIADKTGITIGKETLRRICKRAGLKWKRIKKTLKNEKDDKAYQDAVDNLSELLKKEKQGKIEVFYFDESGFNLQPCIPYAWQENKKYIKVPSSRSKNLNVLGFINHNCQFESFVFENTVDTDVVVACFDKFAQKIEKPTYVVIDNAPTHTSDYFLAHLDEWEESGLYVIPLPAYSPELNIIEILWRKIKYEWLSFGATESLTSLRNELFDILKNIGGEYTIAYS